MTMFTVAIDAVASPAAAFDLFELVPPATTRLLIHELVIGQSSDDILTTSPELLALKFLRGQTSGGSGGSAATPAGFNAYQRAAVTTGAGLCETMNTMVASGGSPETLWADIFNVDAGFIWRPQFPPHQTHWRDHLIVVKPGQRFVVNCSAPADALTISATLRFQEIGKGATG